MRERALHRLTLTVIHPDDGPRRPEYLIKIYFFMTLEPPVLCIRQIAIVIPRCEGCPGTPTGTAPGFRSLKARAS